MMSTSTEPFVVGSAVKLTPSPSAPTLDRDYGIGFVLRVGRLAGYPAAIVTFPKVAIRVALPIDILQHYR
ncbi:MAG: hypothetical protein RIS35_2469 [Pseudomonadota bacterium]|jgi:hypothetical protein